MASPASSAGDGVVETPNPASDNNPDPSSIGKTDKADTLVNDVNFRLWNPETETAEHLARLSIIPTEDVLDQQLQTVGTSTTAVEYTDITQAELGRCAMDVRRLNPFWEGPDPNRALVPGHTTKLKQSFRGGMRRVLREHCLGVSMTKDDFNEV
jgi:hypothetical protein